MAVWCRSMKLIPSQRQFSFCSRSNSGVLGLFTASNIMRRQNHHQATPTKFRILDGAVDKNSSEYLENMSNSEQVISKFKAIFRFATAGGSEKAVERHVVHNKKLLVKDRLALLFDNVNEILELSPLAGMGMKYGNIPRAGLLTAIGKINGVYCLVVANDATVKAGTMFPISVKKQVRSIEVGLENGLPGIYVVDSGGAFLPMQAEIFPDRKEGGRTFYSEAVLNSMDIPQVAIVCGSCTAGAAYVPTMAQEAIIVDKIGTIFLGGPPLVQAALGEVVSPDELGGAKLHCRVSGCTDYYAETEEEAIKLGRASVAAFNIDPVETKIGYEEPAYDADDLLGLIPADKNGYLDMHKVIARIVDGSLFHEFKASYGQTIVTGFCHIKGYLVGIVGNNGVMTSEAALKASHFVQLCSQRNIILIFLQHIVSNSTSNDDAHAQAVLDGEKLRNQAKFMSSVACAGVPIVTVVTGNSHGVESYMMGGRSFNPRFLFCWPNASVCISDPEHLADRIAKDELSGMEERLTDDKAQELRQTIHEKCLEQSTALYSSSQVWDDGIILPQDTRKVLGQCLDIINQNKRFRNVAAQAAVTRM